MRDHGEVPQIGPDDTAAAPLDRTGQDGAAGTGDMLGDLSTGAGGRLGPDDAETMPPMPANQHSFADVVLPIDTDPDDHDTGEPA